MERKQRKPERVGVKMERELQAPCRKGQAPCQPSPLSPLLTVDRLGYILTTPRLE